MSEAPEIYHFDPDTGIFVGTGVADPDPMNEGGFLVPAFAAETPPPTAGANEAAVFEGGAWILVPDWRGHTYWLPDCSQHTIEALGETPPPDALGACPPPPLEDTRAAALRTVDGQAEAARLQFITPGEGQAWTYMRKEREAEAYQADPSPAPANYPLLSACIPGDGADLAAVVVSVLAARDAWLVAGAAIEGIRRAAKAQVEAAPDAAAIQTILDGLTWPQP